jgi:glutathione S-transferase
MTEYTLYYWPIPFRGHFIRMVLAEAGAIWDEPGFDAVQALKTAEPQPYPFMGPPVLVDHATGSSLSQAPAILMFLGRQHDLTGDPDTALRVICDAMDVLSEITRSHGDRMWERGAWEAFVTQRLPRWMRMHEQSVSPGAGAYLGGGRPSLTDLALCALWHTMIDRLPGMRPVLHRHAPSVEALVERVAARPRIAAMLDGWHDRRPLYCGGQIEASILEMLEAG